MRGLGPYNQRQIDGDFVLSVLQKLVNGTRGFKLTSTWVAYGDSYIGPNANFGGIGPALSEDTGTAWVNRGDSGELLSYMTTRPGWVSDLTGLGSYDGPSTIDYAIVINYGLNDYNNSASTTLQNDAYQYGGLALATYLTATLPPNKIIDIRNFTRIGTGVVNNAPFGYGVNMTELGSGVSSESVTGRYYAFFFYVKKTAEITENKFSILIDDVEVSNPIFEYRTTVNSFSTYQVAVLIDMKTLGSRKVSILKNVDNIVLQHLAYMAAWNDKESAMRNVLVIAPCINIWTSAMENRERFDLVNNAQIEAVKTCRKSGLPVYRAVPDRSSNVFYDGVHLTKQGFSELSQKLINDDIFDILPVAPYS